MSGSSSIVLAFGPISDVSLGMPEILVSSKTDLTIGTSGGVDIADVIGGVELVKIVEDRGIMIWESKVPKQLVWGRGGMEVIIIVEVMGEDVVSGGLNGGGVEN